jgi:hypothetical protein
LCGGTRSGRSRRTSSAVRATIPPPSPQGPRPRTGGNPRPRPVRSPAENPWGNATTAWAREIPCHCGLYLRFPMWISLWTGVYQAGMTGVSFAAWRRDQAAVRARVDRDRCGRNGCVWSVDRDGRAGRGASRASSSEARREGPSRATTSAERRRAARDASRPQRLYDSVPSTSTETTGSTSWKRWTRIS